MCLAAVVPAENVALGDESGVFLQIVAKYTSLPKIPQFHGETPLRHPNLSLAPLQIAKSLQGEIMEWPTMAKNAVNLHRKAPPRAGSHWQAAANQLQRR